MSANSERPRLVSPIDPRQDEEWKLALGLLLVFRKTRHQLGRVGEEAIPLGAMCTR